MLRLWDEATDNLCSAANVNFFIIIVIISKLLKGDIPHASANVLSPYPLQVSSEWGGKAKGDGSACALFLQVLGS